MHTLDIPVPPPAALARPLRPTRHKQIYSVDRLTLKTTAAQQVRIGITGTTFTPGWSQFILVPCQAYRATPLHHHYDAWGVPPSGAVIQTIEDIAFEHILPAGDYMVTIHSFTGSTTIHTSSLRLP